MNFTTRLGRRRIALILINTVATLVAIGVVELADLSPLWVVAAALVSGAVCIGAVAFFRGSGQAGAPRGAQPPPTPAAGSPPAATLPG